MKNQQQVSAKHDRLLHHMVVRGKVIATDLLEDQGLVKVKIGNQQDGIELTLPWLRRRGGKDWEWWAPEIDESVIILSVEGDLSNGVIIGSLPYPDKPAFTTAEKGQNLPLREIHTEGKKDSLKQNTTHLVQYEDGSSFYYNKKEHFYQVNLSNQPIPDDKQKTDIPAKIYCGLNANEEKSLVNFEEKKAANQISLFADATKDKEKITLDAANKSTLTISAEKDKEALNLDVKQKVLCELSAEKDKEQLELNVNQKSKLTLSGKAGKEEAQLNVADKAVVKLSADGAIEITWGASKIMMEKSGSVSIQCTDFNLTASGNINLKGASVNMQQ